MYKEASTPVSVVLLSELRDTRTHNPDNASSEIRGLAADPLRDAFPAESAVGAGANTARDTTADAAFGFDRLCSRCGVEFHLAGDELGPACRAEIDAAFRDLPGAEA